MSKRFHARSILKPEKNKEEENWEEDEEKRRQLTTKKAPTSVFDGINEDREMRTSREVIMKDISQDSRNDNEDDEWEEERV